ncbi:MAG: hypothetical protein EHM45_02295 [Desulfobacteraceae bacterium]|nr:MAG: hypothetical protein EHM45_02295 [Desulfobacteraceae bacterium]
MGEKLVRYYKFVEDKKGMEGRIKLAQETKVPSVKAATAPDSPETIKVFREAIKKLTGEEPPVY